MANALVLSESSDDETKANETKIIKEKRGSRISRLSMDSDESEKEDVQVKPKASKKKREKSQRRREKDKHNADLVKRLKNKTEVVVFYF